MTFNIPKDYQAPEGITDGKAFKELATFSVSNGKMTLISVGEEECAITPSDKSKPKTAKMAIDEELAKSK